MSGRLRTQIYHKILKKKLRDACRSLIYQYSFISSKYSCVPLDGKCWDIYSCTEASAPPRRGWLTSPFWHCLFTLGVTILVLLRLIHHHTREYRGEGGASQHLPPARHLPTLGLHADHPQPGGARTWHTPAAGKTTPATPPPAFSTPVPAHALRLLVHPHLRPSNAFLFLYSAADTRLSSFSSLLLSLPLKHLAQSALRLLTFLHLSAPKVYFSDAFKLG